tara:strand:- start:89 stop:1120 length:1032 start_codon:yes stop_codon:yes gene_type:complete
MKKFTLITLVILCFLGCADKVAPDVMLTNPRTGADLRDIVTVTVDASDDEKLKKVELYINGSLHETSSGGQSIHTFTWNTDAGDNGNYSLYAKAFDDAGNNTTSDMIDVTVTNYRTWTLINQSLTSMSYEFGGHSGWIAYGSHSGGEDTVRVEMEKNLGSTIFTAETSGHSYCGYTLSWYKEHDVNDQDQTWYFWIGDKYFMVYLWNNMDYDIDYFIVNKDTDKEKYCWDDVVKNSTEWNLMGYYDAITVPNLYAYFTGHSEYSYIYWDGFSYETWTNDGNNLYQAFAPELSSGLFSGLGNQDVPPTNTINSFREVVKGGVMSEKPLDVLNLPLLPMDIKRNR